MGSAGKLMGCGGHDRRNDDGKVIGGGRKVIDSGKNLIGSVEKLCGIGGQLMGIVSH